MITDKERAQRTREQKWNRALMAGDPDLPAYTALASQRRTFVSIGTNLAVWQLASGQPDTKMMLQVSNIFASPHGFTVYLQMPNGTTLTVGHRPRRIPGTRSFVWVPRYADARYVPGNLEDPFTAPRFSLSVMVGSPGHPERLEEGVEYLTYARDLPDVCRHLATQGEVVDA